MPKVSNKDIYAQDPSLDMEDYLLGTNYNSTNKKTQTYSLSSIFSLFYNFLGYNAFLFTTDTDTYPIASPGCFFAFDEDNEITSNFQQAKKLTFSSNDTYNFNVTEYLQMLVDSDKFLFKLINLEDKNNFIFLKPRDFTLSNTLTSFDVNIEIQYGLSNGNFVNYKKYLLLLEFDANTFDPADYDLTDFTNTSVNPFVTAQDLTNAIALLPAPITNHSELNLDDGTNPHGTTKNDVGLGNVPNLDTTDAVNKVHEHINISILNGTEESFTTALKNAYNSAVSWIITNGTNLINHLTNTSNPHNVTKSQIGLGNVDNTSDLNKPISTATQQALNNKLDKGTYTGNASDLVPYTGANKDVNIGDYFYKTSKGFDFIKNGTNYFKVFNYGDFNSLEFNSMDTSANNYGSIYMLVNPAGGFVFQKYSGNTSNQFNVNIDKTYSQKKFVTDEGYQITNGTANQSLTADGGTFDLNTKADLVGGKVPSSQLPSYVDDVLEFANLASFPATGESGKIYIALDTNLTYRWGGSSYVVMSSSLTLGETSSTAYRGDRGKIAYDHSQVTGNPHNTTKADIGLGNVDNTSDLNKPISNATQNELNLKLSIESPSTTGTLLSFTTDKVSGTLTTPETGNITADVTNAKLGVTNIIIHNSGTAPTFGSQFKKLSGSGNYATGVVNYIYCTYISATEIIYSINQRA